MQNMDWLEEELGGYEDDYLIFDCPGLFIISYHQNHISPWSMGRAD
jgi:hypothetical protein